MHAVDSVRMANVALKDRGGMIEMKRDRGKVIPIHGRYNLDGQSTERRRKPPQPTQSVVSVQKVHMAGIG